MKTENAWTYWSHLALLNSYVNDEGNESMYEEGTIDQRLACEVDGRKLNREDPALLLFLKVCGLPNPADHSIELYNIKHRLNAWNYVNVENERRKLGFGDKENLDELFSIRARPHGWEELDRLTHLIAGITFSKIVDTNKSVVMDYSDPGLGGENPYYAQINKWSAAIQLDTILICHEDLIRMDCAIIGSSLDILMKNVMEYLRDFPCHKRDSCEHPDQLVLLNSSGKILSFPVAAISENEPGLKISYNNLDWHKTGQGVLKSVLSALPVKVHNKVRGTMFTSDLGL